MARFPNRVSGWDGHPRCYHRLEYDVLFFFSSSLFHLAFLPCLSLCCLSHPRRQHAGNFLSSVLLHACSSYLPFLSTNTCRLLFAAFSGLLASFAFCFISEIHCFVVVFFFVYLHVLFLLVLLCSRTPYASISLAPPMNLRLFLFMVFLCLTVCDHIISISLG